MLLLQTTLSLEAALPFLQEFPGHRFGEWMMGGWWTFGMVLGWIFWIALLVLVVVIIWRLVESRGARREPDGSPLDILRRRYARGEIDRQEFEDKKRDLGYG